MKYLIFVILLFVWPFAPNSFGGSDERKRPTPLPPTPLEIAFKKYLIASNEFNKNPIDRLEREVELEKFHQLWRIELSKHLASSNENDPWRFQILSELKALNIALKDFHDALSISRLLSKSAPTEKLRARSQIASINILYLAQSYPDSDFDQEDVLMELERYEKAMQSSQIEKDLIFVDSMNIAGDLSAAFGRYSKAIEFYREASGVISSVGFEGKMGTLYADVILLKSVKLGIQNQIANTEHWDQLLELEGGAYAKGYRLYELARTVELNGGKDGLDILEKYYPKVAGDDWGLFIIKEMAEASFNRGDYIKAVEYMSKFLSVDFAAFNPKNPGISDRKRLIRDALNTFALSLKMLGDSQSEEEVKRLVKRFSDKWDRFVSQSQETSL